MNMQALVSKTSKFHCSVFRVQKAPQLLKSQEVEKETKLSLHTFFLERKYAPLAQLVEQLTLNQWVQGSNP